MLIKFCFFRSKMDGLGCVCFIDGELVNGNYVGGQNTCVVVTSSTSREEFIAIVCDALSLNPEEVSFMYTTRFDRDIQIRLNGDSDMRSLIMLNSGLARVYIYRLPSHTITSVAPVIL